MTAVTKPKYKLPWGRWDRAFYSQWMAAGGCRLSQSVEQALCKKFYCNVNKLEQMPIMSLLQSYAPREDMDPSNAAGRELSRFVREHADQINWSDDAPPLCECDDAILPGTVWPADADGVQRCDLCCRYHNDFEAARAVAKLIGAPDSLGPRVIRYIDEDQHETYHLEGFDHEALMKEYRKHSRTT